MLLGVDALGLAGLAQIVGCLRPMADLAEHLYAFVIAATRESRVVIEIPNFPDRNLATAVGALAASSGEEFGAFAWRELLALLVVEGAVHRTTAR